MAERDDLPNDPIRARYGTWPSSPVAPAVPVQRTLGATTDDHGIAMFEMPKAMGGNLNDRDAIMAHTNQVLNNLRVSQEANARYLSSAADSLKQVTSIWAEAMGVDAGSLGAGGTPIRTGVRRGVRMRRMPGGDEGPSGMWESFDDARSATIGEFAGDIRNKAAGWLARRLPETGPQVMRSPEGAGYIDPSRPDARLSTMDVARMTIGGEIHQAVSSGIRGMQSGEGFMAGMKGASGPMSGLAKGIGGAGLAVTAGLVMAQQGWDFARSQLRQNLPYRQILGTDNAGAFAERAGLGEFKIGQYLGMGGLSGADAEKLYLGVLQAGYRGGDERRFVQGFGVRNYQKYGMPVEDSLALVHAAVQGGQEDLFGYADALDQVSKSAKESRVSVIDAQKEFINNVRLVNTMMGSTGGGGKVTPVLASAISALKESGGPALRDTSFTGLLSSPAFMEMSALRLGFRDAAQMLNPNTIGPGGERLGEVGVARLAGRSISQQIAPLFQMVRLGPALQQFLSRYPQAADAHGMIRSQFIDAFLNDPGTRAMIPARADFMVAQMLQSMGEDPGPQPLRKLLSMYYAEFSMGSNAAEQADLPSGPTGAQTRTMGGRRDLYNQIMRQGGFNEAVVMGREQWRKRHRAGDPAPPPPGVRDVRTPQERMADEAGSYREYVDQAIEYGTSRAAYEEGGFGGQSETDRSHNLRRAFVKQAMGPHGFYSDIAEWLVDHPSVRLRVDGPGGKKYEVSAHTAMTRFYDQVVEGTAMVTTGEYAGMTLAQATGRTGVLDHGLKSSREGGPRRRKELERAATKGEALIDTGVERGGVKISKWTGEDRERLERHARGHDRGGVRIDLSPRAHRYFKIVESMVGETNQERAALPPGVSPRPHERAGVQYDNSNR